MQWVVHLIDLSLGLGVFTFQNGTDNRIRVSVINIFDI
jgi:hypothetical protein